MAPATQKQWHIESPGSFDSLKFDTDAPVPTPGDHEVLVKFHAASLNYRDLIIALGSYPFATRDGVVPASDGAGVVEAVGRAVTRFKAGDRVATLFNQAHIGGPVTPDISKSGVGGTIDGALREYGTYGEHGLVRVPDNLSLKEASTLPCAALTAWNALYGLLGKELVPGMWVLTQGTGGVSVFALQFAKAAGAKVVATTSSADKAKTLKELGADHVINYKENPEWGQKARELTKDGDGFDHIIEVGGPTTISESLKAVRMEGVISIIGFLGGQTDKQPGMLDALLHQCTVRGVLVGSRLQFEAMNRSIEATDVHPVLDPKEFSLDEVKEAFQYQWDQRHFGKVCVSIA